MKEIKLLVVDDSVFFCTAMQQLLTTGNYGIRVIGTAASAREARDKILSLRPDVLTLDINMSGMDGIRFLKQLIPQYPIPCVVITGAEISASEVFAAGGMGLVRKAHDGENMHSFADRVAEEVISAAARANRGGARQDKRKTYHPVQQVKPVQQGQLQNAMSLESRIGAPAGERIIALGASTGGTDALEVVLKSLPADCPPIVIVQHMPPVFTQMYAERLNKSCAMDVKEAADGDRLRKGLCLVAAGDKHMYLRRDASGYYVHCEAGDKVSGHCPSVDVLFDSVAEAAGSSAVGAILTGMGADGAKGLKKMRSRGAYTIGQDEQSCVVYGMPMEAYNIGAVCEQQPLSDIGDAIMRRCR